MDAGTPDPAVIVQSGIVQAIPAGVGSEATADRLREVNPANDALRVETDLEETVESGEAAERRRRRRRRGGRRDRPEGERTETESGLIAEGSDPDAIVTETAPGEATFADGVSVPAQERPARAPRTPRSRRPIDSDVPSQETVAPASQVEPAEATAPVGLVAPTESTVSIEPIAAIIAVEPTEVLQNSADEVPAEPPVFGVAAPESLPAEAEPITTGVGAPALVAPTPEAPVVLTEIVANAGLEWVQTRSDLVIAEGSIEAPTPRPPRPARVRKPKVEVVVEPLQMVETKNDAPL